MLGRDTWLSLMYFYIWRISPFRMKVVKLCSFNSFSPPIALVASANEFN